MEKDKQDQTNQMTVRDMQYPFKDNLSVFVFKKVEKITLASYLITEHLSDTEPLRRMIREIAVHLIKDTLYSPDERSEIRGPHLKKTFFELATLLDLGAKTNLFAVANVSILKEQMANIVREVETKKNGVVLDKRFFDVGGRVSVISDQGHEDTETRNSKSEIRKKEIKPAKKEKKVAMTAFASKASKKAGNRDDQILNIIKKKGTVMIKDISEEITNCSEKTIQRALQKMVMEGILNREGERRWSIYRLSS